MHEDGSQFAMSMAAVAQELLGAPNQRLSSDVLLCYGNNGSLKVDIVAGRFYDHEQKAGGGVLDLISRETKTDHRGAAEWMKEHGYLEAAPDQVSNGKGLGREVAHYDYVDENDALLFQVVRFEPKTFRQRRRDASGAWSWSVRGVRQVPYCLPDLMEAISVDRPVYIVEGEKDVQNLRNIGLIGTTNAGGAGKWRSELDEHFRGADVVIIPDNDLQSANADGSLRFHPDGSPVFTGMDHARNIASHLHGIAKRVRILDLSQHWRDMPAKGDVTDWIKAGGNSEALQALVERVEDWSPTQFRSRFGGLRWEQIATLGHASGYTWLVEDIFPMGEISLAYGDSGSGKSFGIFDMGMACARGLAWNGKNTERGLVVYVAAEAGKGFGKRKLAYIIQHELPHDAVFPFYLMTKRPDFFSGDVDLNALMEEISAIAKSYSSDKLVLIVVDTLSAAAPGMNENASQDISMVRKRLVVLQERFGAAVILVHHKPKGGGSPRGHSSLTADFETTIEFEIATDKRTPSGGNIHRATVRKQREGKAGIRWEFTLPSISVGRNKWGNEETSCAVVPFETGQSTLRGGYSASANERLLLHALYAALDEYGVAPPFPLPHAITKVVNVQHVRENMRAKVVDDDADAEAADNRFRGAFKRSGDRLRDAGIIGIQKPYWWTTGKAVNGM